MTTSATEASVDSATVEVIRNYLQSAANEMQRTLIRTAYNTAIYEMLDFGISIYDADLNLVADSPGLTLFLGANDYSIEKGVEYVGEENLNPGDVVMMNYPYWSSAHTLDPCLFSPVFNDDGEEIIGYTVVRAHWMDLGAKDAAYVHDSTEVYQEGLLFPGTKVYKEGEPDDEIIELLRFNTRVSEKVIGDLNAQIATLKVGRRRLQELHRKYGSETIATAVDRVATHGEEQARAALRELPDGTWYAEDYVDDDGINDELVKVAAEVTIDGDDFGIDFSASSDEVEGPINVPYGETITMGKLCLKTLTTPREPSNAGHYEPLSVTAPEGNLFHATHPAPTFTLWPSMLGVETVFKALSKGLDSVPAHSGGDICAFMMWGDDPETGRSYMLGCNEGVGWGGTDEHDGANGLMHITESNVRNTPVEILEHKAPVEVECVELRTDSGGAGRQRGGLGIHRSYQFTADTNALVTVKKTKTDGWGVDGGTPGARNEVVLRPGTGEERSTGTCRDSFAAGERLWNRSGGGGGYGDPYERPPEAVRADVVDGYVTREAAREEYGVVLDADGTVDETATRDRRNERT
ncbi:hydantoinase B/oxoprolinase family protein [Halorarius halobius]|uniref:hydantoinase B/oxoprolinase family protein n=1 Tax=Halorarius halobius TaxID=2962671 RepID=UPI0020CE3295|nr:hydantoinase B/oxoprolinase family protein [Halorarius halobius]